MLPRWRGELEEEAHYFPSESEMDERFSETQLAKTLAIAKECDVDLTIGKFIFPEFTLPTGVNADEYLRELALRGIEARGFQNRPDV